ncbi:hypothetical protein V6N13_033507 [Hibiscus sabdariffa]|uniref:Uncharacterized protein n=1 Tax=Hibiscus sabdariffa TaxID=183260 RepID=A0ABR2FA95_9ROSI
MAMKFTRKHPKDYREVLIDRSKAACRISSLPWFDLTTKDEVGSFRLILSLYLNFSFASASLLPDIASFCPVPGHEIYEKASERLP